MTPSRMLSLLCIAACVGGSARAGSPPVDAPPLMAAKRDPGCDPARAEKLLFGAADRTRHVAAHGIARCAAEAGDPAGQHLLSIALWYGLGTQKDPTASLRWIERAVAQGHLPALKRLGVMLVADTGELDSDVPRGVALLKQAAQAGDLEAMVAVGDLYRDGEGLARDDRDAVRWYAVAAHRGSPAAQLRYAHMAARGRGMHADAQACFLYASLAANRNEPRARLQALACESRLTPPVRERVRTEIDLWQPPPAAH